MTEKLLCAIAQKYRYVVVEFRVEKGRLVWALARQRAFQLPAPMAETGLDLWFRERARFGSWMVVGPMEPLGLR